MLITPRPTSHVRWCHYPARPPSLPLQSMSAICPTNRQPRVLSPAHGSRLMPPRRVYVQPTHVAMYSGHQHRIWLLVPRCAPGAQPKHQHTLPQNVTTHKLTAPYFSSCCRQQQHPAFAQGSALPPSVPHGFNCLVNGSVQAHAHHMGRPLGDLARRPAVPSCLAMRSLLVCLVHCWPIHTMKTRFTPYPSRLPETPHHKKTRWGHPHNHDPSSAAQASFPTRVPHLSPQHAFAAIAIFPLAAPYSVGTRLHHHRPPRIM